MVVIKPRREPRRWASDSFFRRLNANKLCGSDVWTPSSSRKNSFAACSGPVRVRRLVRSAALARAYHSGHTVCHSPSTRATFFCRVEDTHGGVSRPQAVKRGKGNCWRGALAIPSLAVGTAVAIEGRLCLHAGIFRTESESELLSTKIV